jgi:hypothetical protein
VKSQKKKKIPAHAFHGSVDVEKLSIIPALPSAVFKSLCDLLSFSLTLILLKYASQKANDVPPKKQGKSEHA